MGNSTNIISCLLPSREEDGPESSLHTDKDPGVAVGLVVLNFFPLYYIALPPHPTFKFSYAHHLPPSSSTLVILLRPGEGKGTFVVAEEDWVSR